MNDLITMKKILEQKLINVQGVVGVSADPIRKTIVVYVEDRSVIDKIRSMVRGYPVTFKVVGRVSVA